MNPHEARAVHLSYTAPSLPSPMIQRPHLISAIIQLFDSYTDTVCVESQPGYGKTTLLREFAEYCDEPCFSVFLRAGSRHSYDPVLARVDLANQLNWYLDSRRLRDDEEPSEIDLRTLLNRCTRNLSRRKSNAYFIIDGLDKIPDEDNALLQAIMNLLPFGITTFRFLFSSDSSKNIFRHNKTLHVKSFVLMAFNSHETDEFMSDIVDDKSLRMQYHNALGGVPALLASARRQLLSQSDRNESEALSLPPDIDTFLNAEWNLIAPLSESAETVVSYILAYGRPISAKQLSLYTGLSLDQTNDVLLDLPFLSYLDNLSGWGFTSEPFREFAERKLRHRVKNITQEIATKLLHDPDSDEALTLLPQYLRRIGDANKILEWFDEHRFAKILLSTRTPAWTEPILRNAIVLSHDARNDRALTTYSLLRSIVPQISNTTGIEHEIRARCVLGDIEGAQAVVYAVPLLSQRLRLLAVLIDAASDRPGLAIQPLRDELRELVPKIDLDLLQKEEAIDLAIDLYPVDHHLALRILKSTLRRDSAEQSVELAMARITVAALQSQQSTDTSISRDDTTPKSSEILIDERIQRFFNATKLSLNAKTAADVLSLSAQLEESSEKLFILRKWIDQHRTTKDVLLVVETAINEAIISTEFIPTATFYREILEPLPYASDKILRLKLIAMIDAQRPVMQSKGPTIDYVRVQLLLAGCNCDEEEWQKAANRLEDLYLDCIASIDSLETQTACLSWCLGALARFDPDRDLDGVSDIHDLIESEFERSISQVLDDCAEQYTILEKSLQPLAEFVPSRGLELCSRLNTGARRSQALFYFVKVLAGVIHGPSRFTIIFEAIDLLAPGPLLDNALFLLAGKVARSIETGEASREDLDMWFARLDKSSSSTEKCESLGEVVAALTKTDQYSDSCNRASAKLLDEFKNIINPRDRYTIGCKLIVVLHPRAPSLARKVFELVSNDNQVSRLPENVERGSYYVLSLLTKASSALSRAGLLEPDDVRRICLMVTDVPDRYMRVQLFSRLAFFYWEQEQRAHFASIVNDYIWKELDGLRTGDQELLFLAWIDAYRVVWLENRDRARNAVAEFPKTVRYSCVQDLCWALLYKLPPGEPFDGRGRGQSTLTYSDIRNLLILCDEIDDDGAIFGVLEGIADQAGDTDHDIRLTRDQQAEIGRLIHEISDGRFPSSEGVQHLGYRIVSKAQALRVTKGSNEQWLRLIAEGKELKNQADCVLVCALLASYLPKRMRGKRDELFKGVEEIVDSFQSVEDRYQRYLMLARVAMDWDRELASRVTKKAFRTVTVSDDRRNATREQRIVDMAYSVDPELPMKLAVLYDDDPAREQYRERAKSLMKCHELKRELADFREDLALRERDNDPDLAVAAWQSLGALNAGRIIAVNMNRARDMLACASNYPLEKAYPMYSWVLSNVMDKYANTPQSSQYLRDLFEGVARGAGFFFMMSGAESRFDFNPTWDRRDEEEVHAVIRSGERDKAILFLKRWFQGNLDEVVTIVDPYFGPDDLWVVRLIMESDPSVDVRIMTGCADERQSATVAVSDSYRSKWRKLCDQDPPYTEVLQVSFVDSGKTPIHDRWIFSKSAGLRLGTSLNSIGTRLSELSAMDSKELDKVRDSVDGYLKRNIRQEDGQRVAYELFELLP